MERLTEEKQFGSFAALKDKAEAVPGAFATYECFYAHMVAVTRLKQYEDAMLLERAQELAQAEKDGRLVVLPCKVGDWVYILDLEKKAAVKIRVQGISISANGRTILHFGGYPSEYRWGDRYGKDWFLTREEAEASLKKREEASQACHC